MKGVVLASLMVLSMAMTIVTRVTSAPLAPEWELGGYGAAPLVFLVEPSEYAYFVDQFGRAERSAYAVAAEPNKRNVTKKKNRWFQGK